MKVLKTLAIAGGLALVAANADAQNLLGNGNLDMTYQQEIVPGFFLPKPEIWVNEGSRTIAGPFEDEMSSEPWAGPAPTPVTTDGANGDDWGVFFKPFSGSVANGATTAHLYQDVAGSAGTQYKLTGWAGAEANALFQAAVFALDYLDVSGGVISSNTVDLVASGLFVDNGQPFDYKQYSVSGTAPAGTVSVRARASMIGAMGNPAGGGQAFVVDDFELTVVPEPTALAMAGLALAGLAIRRRK